MCRHECTSRRVQRKLLVMGVSLTVGSEGEFKRGSSGGPKLITALTELSSFHSLLDYATSIYINGFIHLRSWSNLQFPALETVILRDIVDVLGSQPAASIKLRFASSEAAGSYGCILRESPRGKSDFTKFV